MLCRYSDDRQLMRKTKTACRPPPISDVIIVISEPYYIDSLNMHQQQMLGRNLQLEKARVAKKSSYYCFALYQKFMQTSNLYS